MIPPVNDLVKLSIAKTTVRVGGVLKYSKDFTYSQTIDSTLLVWDQMMNYNPAQILVRAKDAHSYADLNGARIAIRNADDPQIGLREQMAAEAAEQPYQLVRNESSYADGTFKFLHLQPQTYSFYASKPGYFADHMRVLVAGR